MLRMNEIKKTAFHNSIKRNEIFGSHLVKCVESAQTLANDIKVLRGIQAHVRRQPPVSVDLTLKEVSDDTGTRSPWCLLSRSVGQEVAHGCEHKLTFFWLKCWILWYLHV